MIRNMPACALHKRVIQFAERSGAAVGNGTIDKRAYNALDLRVRFGDITGNVTRHNTLELLDGSAEDILVFCAGFLRYLDVCAVKRAESYCTVEHEFHVAGTGSLGSRRGYLLGNISRSDQLLRIGYAVVAYEYDVQQILCRRVGIDQLCDLVNVLDDALRAVYPGADFAPKMNVVGVKSFKLPSLIS